LTSLRKVYASLTKGGTLESGNTPSQMKGNRTGEGVGRGSRLPQSVPRLERYFPVVRADVRHKPSAGAPWIVHTGHSHACPHCLLDFVRVQLTVNVGRDRRLKQTQNRVKKAIARVLQAAGDVEYLRGEPLSLAHPDKGDLLLLPARLQIAARGFEKARRSMMPGKKPFFENIRALLVAVVWEMTGSPNHELVADYLERTFLEAQEDFSTEAHARWVQRHTGLIDKQRLWVRDHLGISAERVRLRELCRRNRKWLHRLGLL
jgi:hypothetical protein